MFRYIIIKLNYLSYTTAFMLCVFTRIMLLDGKLAPIRSEQSVEMPEDTASNADTRCDTNSVVNTSLNVRHNLITAKYSCEYLIFRVLSYPCQSKKSQMIQFLMLILAMYPIVLSVHQPHPR
jgi:hypothetical protein